MSYEYLVTGELKAIRESGWFMLVAFDYDDMLRRTRLTRGNGTVTTYSYDGISRLSGMAHDMAGTMADVTLGFTYNPAGQIVSRARSNSIYAWTGHVNADRGYSVNGLNQYGQAGATGFSYDARGNLTRSGNDTYSYNSRNQLSYNGTGHLLYHDYLGRLAQVPSIGNMDYIGDQLVTEQYDTVQRRYVYGPGADDAPHVRPNGPTAHPPRRRRYRRDPSARSPSGSRSQRARSASWKSSLLRLLFANGGRSAQHYTQVAERVGFEPTIRF